MMKLTFSNQEECYRLDICEEIAHEGSLWGGNEIRLESVKNSLKETNGKPLEIHINSCGGEVFEGFAIYNNLKDYQGKKTVIIDGIAASIASVIALAGDTIKMQKASMMMIHNASSFCYGTSKDMQEVAKSLDSITAVIRSLYVAKTGLSEEQVKELMDNETYLSAEKALEYGFCDEILEEEKDNQAETLNAMNVLNETIQARITSLNQLRFANAELIDGSKPKHCNKALTKWLEENE